MTLRLSLTASCLAMIAAILSACAGPGAEQAADGSLERLDPVRTSSLREEMLALLTEASLSDDPLMR